MVVALALGGLRLAGGPPDAPVIDTTPTAEPVTLGHPAGPLTVSAGHVWVADYAGSTVSSPTGGAPVTIDEPGRTCELIATTPRPTVRRCGDGDDVLVLPDGSVATVPPSVQFVVVDDEVWEVTAETAHPLGAPRRSVNIGDGRHTLTGGDALWVTTRLDDGSVTIRRLTAEGDTTHTWPLGPLRRGSRLSPDGEGGAWALDQATGTVWRLDDGGAGQVVPAAAPGSSAGIAGDASCAAAWSGRTVTLVPRGGPSVAVELTVGVREAVVLGGRVWLRTTEDDLLTMPCPT